MKSSCPPLLPCLSLVLLASAATAQNELWVRQLGTNGTESVLDSAPDESGGVYVCGWTNGSLGGPNQGIDDAWLARYDGTGNQLWIHQIGQNGYDAALAVASDGSGGVYVGGWTQGSLGGPPQGGGDAWLARYDGAGNRLWIVQAGGSYMDQFLGASPDGSGGVYVTGRTGSWGEPWLVRYDGAGNQLWSHQWGAGYPGTLSAVVPDGSGGVYVGGWFSGFYYMQTVVLEHYDSAGNLLWSRSIYGSLGTDWADAAAVDGSGGVYLVGTTSGHLGGPNAGSLDAWIAHYDYAGNQLWTRQFGTSGTDWAWAAAPDGSGGVVVGGSTDGSLGGPSAGAWDAWLAHYDGAGQPLWVRQFGTSQDEGIASAAPDGSCGVYSSGWTGGALGGPYAGGSADAFLVRHACDLGTPYCTPAVPNSTGLPGLLGATGSGAVLDDDVTLIADQLPAGQFGYFLVSQTQGLVQPPGSQGLLCLSGNIGRYNRIAEVVQGPTGSIQLDLTSIPVNPPQAVLPGDTWNFQCWYRDVNPTPTSNFTDAVSVTFQ